MKVYRSQYWYKGKTWFSDFPKPFNYENDTCDNRLVFDKTIFSKETGLTFDEVDNMIHTAIHSNLADKKGWRPKDEGWFKEFGWKMYDFGEVELHELRELITMS